MSEFSSDDVQRLTWFVAVAEELHFGRAAKTLNIARQKLSAAVIELEAELGHKLFVPGAQPTELSAEGHALLLEAREFLAAEAAKRVEEVPATVAGLRVGFVPGVTVSKWTRIWSERFPTVPLEVIPVEAADQEHALREARVDMAFVRLPIERDGMKAIPLYRETPVVVVPKEHLFAMVELIATADLVDEQVHSADDIDSITATFELVAAGVGVVVVPHSIARLHARKDLVYRTVTDAPDTEIALAWLADRETELFEEFVGVVRGRSLHSSRAPVKSEPRRAPKPKARNATAGRGQPKKQVAKGKKPRRR